MPKIPASVKRGARRAVRGAGKSIGRIANAANRAAVQELRTELTKLKLGQRMRGAKMLLTGSGDYTTNALVSGTGRATGTPTFGSTRIVVNRRELLDTVVSSAVAGQFALQKYVVNPGDVATFPWLAPIAGVFESWIPRGVVFEYVSLSGTAVGSTNTALGQVILAPQYNAYAVDPFTKTQLEGFPDAVSVCVDTCALAGVECKAGRRPSESLFVRNSNVLPDDIRGGAGLFDLCDFFVASSGCQGASITLGEIWINYSIELFNPIIPTDYGFIGFGVTMETGATTGANFLTGATVTDLGGHIVVQPLGKNVFFRASANSSWIVTLMCDQAGAAAANDIDIDDSTGCAVLPDSFLGPEPSQASGDHLFSGVITLTGAGECVIVFATTFVGNYDSLKLSITPAPAEFAYPS